MSTHLGEQVYNYRTNQYDVVSGLPRNADALAAYIPQRDSAQNLFRAYVDSNLEPLKAMANVLHICIGEQPPFPVPESQEVEP